MSSKKINLVRKKAIGNKPLQKKKKDETKK